MKKAIIAFAALLATTTASYAQKGFSLSVKAAPQLSYMLNADDNDNSTYKTKSQFGFAAGIGASYNFTNQLGTGLDALYSSEGSKFELAGNEFNKRISYLKVPVYFAYSFNTGHTFSYTAKLGPQASFLLDSKLKDADGKEIVNNTNDAYSKFNFGAMAGFDVNVQVAPKMQVSLGVRADGTFTNTENEDAAGYPKDRATTRNLTPGVYAGFKYQFGK
jgi:opacity protein-like surface antigen